MALLKSLGIDSTLWFHVVCFAVAYLSISNFVFKPYLKALAERENAPSVAKSKRLNS